MTELEEMETWYKEQCNGEWEHQYGISISTIDNPGWSLKVDLSMTSLAYKRFFDLKIENSEVDWIIARKNSHVLEVFGGVSNLSAMLRVFLNWATK